MRDLVARFRVMVLQTQTHSLLEIRKLTRSKNDSDAVYTSLLPKILASLDNSLDSTRDFF